MGITHRRAVLIIYGVTIALCVGAIAIAFGRQWQVGAAILGVSAVLFGLIRFIGYFEYLVVVGRQKQRIRSRHVEWLRKIIMTVPARFSTARDESEVLALLAWLAREARLHWIELQKDKDVVQRWTGADYQDMDDRDVTMAVFPLDRNGYTVRFGWKSEFGDVPPQMEILLQLVVDQLEQHLRRVGSALVSEAEPETLASDALPAGLRPVRS
jgi:UDP-GlcNAc:undecaprenyl-phosphate GlcNAc-1-phosphate transferase